MEAARAYMGVHIVGVSLRKILPKMIGVDTFIHMEKVGSKSLSVPFSTSIFGVHCENSWLNFVSIIYMIMLANIFAMHSNIKIQILISFLYDLLYNRFVLLR